jgi:hypothetical protein
MGTIIRNAALAATGGLCLIAAPAHAQTVLLDPATLHVGADSTGGAGTDPNLIPSNSEFFVLQQSGGAPATTSFELIFAVPNYGNPLTAPTITSVELNDDETNPPPVTAGPVTDSGLAVTMQGSGQDLYSLLGLTGDASLSFNNFNSGLTANGIPLPTMGYELFTASLTGTGLAGGQNYEVDGSFGLGTYIAPFGANADHTFSTQFTNVGLIDASPVPEPSTWAMLLAGFAALGFAAFRRSAKPRLEDVIA